MDFGVKKSVSERARGVEERYGKTTKGTAEKAKPEPWKVRKVKVGDGGKSFAVEFRKKL